MMNLSAMDVFCGLFEQPDPLSPIRTPDAMYPSTLDELMTAVGLHRPTTINADDADISDSVAWRLYELADPPSPIRTPEEHEKTSTSPVDLPVTGNASSPGLAPPAMPHCPPPTWVRSNCSRQLTFPPGKRRTSRTSLDGVKMTLSFSPDSPLAEPLPSSASSIQSSPDIIGQSSSPVSSHIPRPPYFFGDDFEWGVPLSAKTPTLTKLQRVPIPPPSLVQSSADEADMFLHSSRTSVHFLQCDEVYKSPDSAPPISNPATPPYIQATPNDILASVIAEIGGISSSGSSEEAPTPRTPGASFTEIDWQETELRIVFNKRAYLSGHEKAKLGRKLGLSVENIQRWFKNARRRRSREHERRLSRDRNGGRQFKLDSL